MTTDPFLRALTLKVLGLCEGEAAASIFFSLGFACYFGGTVCCGGRALAAEVIHNLLMGDRL
jgi:hypothetical protein